MSHIKTVRFRDRDIDRDNISCNNTNHCISDQLTAWWGRVPGPPAWPDTSCSGRWLYMICPEESAAGTEAPRCIRRPTTECRPGTAEGRSSEASMTPWRQSPLAWWRQRTSRPSAYCWCTIHSSPGGVEIVCIFIYECWMWKRRRYVCMRARMRVWIICIYV